MIPTDAELRALKAVIDRAVQRHADEGGGILFTAAVVMDGETLALCDNESAQDCDASRHAEIVAMARAQQALGRTDLSGATLIASMQPCEMCLSAMRWAGIDRLVFAMTQERAPAFFQFPQLSIDDFARAADDGFDWSGGHGADRVAHIYEDGA